MSATEGAIVVSVEPLGPEAIQALAPLPTQRDSDLVLAYWLQKTRPPDADDKGPFLDFSVIETEAWRQRFVITVDDAEGSILLLWGSGVADLFGIQAGQKIHVSISRGIPDRYRTIFFHGCAALRDRRTPIRVDAQISLADGRHELVRASFVPIIGSDAKATRLAFGTINRRVA